MAVFCLFNHCFVSFPNITLEMCQQIEVATFHVLNTATVGSVYVNMATVSMS